MGEEKEKEFGDAYVSMACMVQVAVEVMSKRGADSLRRKELRFLEDGREVSMWDSGRASTRPTAETATPALEARS